MDSLNVCRKSERSCSGQQNLLVEHEKTKVNDLGGYMFEKTMRRLWRGMGL
ncbi:MAG TPA: hypothetical protein VLG16_04805 [Candidatus Saccharimonadales bacterium]|nr:hypothetical protein [Candidatus Saccharimonadales bacterium]